MPIIGAPNAVAATAAFSKITVVGHSLSAGGGAPVMEAAWHNLLAGMLRAEIVNYGRGGAVASWTESNVLPYGQTGDGGVGHVMSHFPLPAPYRPYKGAWVSGTTYKLYDIVWTGASLDTLSWWVSQLDSNTGNNPTTDSGTNWLALSASTNQGHPYEPAGQLPIVEFGFNDLGWVGDETSWLNSMRVILSAMLAAEVTCRGVDPRCSFVGTWGAATGGPGISFAGTTTNGLQTVQPNTTDIEHIVTPPDYPGGYVSATYVIVAQTTGGVFQVTVDGSVVLTKNVSTDHIGTTTAGKASGWALRFPVSAGKHHIQIQQTTSYTGSGAYMFTDALILEASPAQPIIVPALHKALTSGVYTTLFGGGTTASDANVDAWNTALQSMLSAEFPTALYLPSVMSDHDATKFYQDGVHPNGHGHALIAADLMTKLTTTVAPSLTTEMMAKMARPPKIGRRVNLIFGLDNPANSISIGTSAWTSLSYTATLSGYTNGTRYIEASISAEPGDMIEIGVIGVWNNDASALGLIDIATLAFPSGVSNTPSFLNYVSTGTTAQNANGLPTGSALNAGIFAPLIPGGPLYYKVQPADLILGQITFRLIAKASTASRYIICAPTNPIHFNLANVGESEYYMGQRQAR